MNEVCTLQKYLLQVHLQVQTLSECDAEGAKFTSINLGIGVISTETPWP
jgi:hypothetical protein